MFKIRLLKQMKFSKLFRRQNKTPYTLHALITVPPAATMFFTYIFASLTVFLFAITEDSLQKERLELNFKILKRSPSCRSLKIPNTASFICFNLVPYIDPLTSKIKSTSFGISSMSEGAKKCTK